MPDDNVREAYRVLLSRTNVRVDGAIDRLVRRLDRTDVVVPVVPEFRHSLDEILRLVADDDDILLSALERLQRGTDTLDQLETALERFESISDVLGITRNLTRALKNAVPSCKYVCADDLHEFACGTTSPGPRCPDGKKYRRVLR